MKKVSPSRCFLTAALCAFTLGTLPAQEAAEPEPTPAPDPERHIQDDAWAGQFINHLREGELDSAYALLHHSARKNFTIEDFRTTVTDLRLTGFDDVRWTHVDDFQRFGRTYAEVYCQVKVAAEEDGWIAIQLIAEEVPGKDGGWKIFNFRPYQQRGSLEEQLLAPLPKECEKILRPIGADFAKAVASDDFTAFDAKHWIPGDEGKNAAALLKKAFASFAPFDLTFLTEAAVEITINEHFINSDDELSLEGVFISDAAYRRLDYTLEFEWDKKSERWLINNLNASIDYHVPDIPEPVPDANAIALAKKTLGAWAESVLDGDFETFAKEKASPYLLEKIGGPEAFPPAFGKFKAPHFQLAELELDSLHLDENTILDQKFLRIGGAVKTGPHALEFSLEFFRESDAWKLKGININSDAPLPESEESPAEDR